MNFENPSFNIPRQLWQNQSTPPRYIHNSTQGSGGIQLSTSVPPQPSPSFVPIGGIDAKPGFKNIWNTESFHPVTPTPAHSFSRVQVSQQSLPSRGFDDQIQSTPMPGLGITTPESINAASRKILQSPFLPSVPSMLKPIALKRTDSFAQEKTVEIFTESSFYDPNAIGEETPEEVVKDLKKQVESLINAISQASSAPQDYTNSTLLDGADAIEVSHRIISRINSLREENVMLHRIANGATSSSLEAKLSLLRAENQRLRQQIEELNAQIDS